MNAIQIHPSRNFLDPRNPSSPFAYQQGMYKACWEYIDDNSYRNRPDGEFWLIINNGIMDFVYHAQTKQELFNECVHHFYPTK